MRERTKDSRVEKMEERQEGGSSPGVMLASSPEKILWATIGASLLRLGKPPTLFLLCRRPARRVRGTCGIQNQNPPPNCPTLPQLRWAIWYNLFCSEKLLSAYF